MGNRAGRRPQGLWERTLKFALRTSMYDELLRRAGHQYMASYIRAAIREKFVNDDAKAVAAAKRVEALEAWDTEFHRIETLIPDNGST